MLLKEITDYLDNLLQTHSIPKDKSQNGLQIEGKKSVEKIIGGVDGCLEIYKRAIEESADLIIVHHGEIWGNGLQAISGHLVDRIGLLVRNSVSLYAVHLPLDAHPTLGHNAKIAELLKLQNLGQFGEYAGATIGVYGDLHNPISVEELSKRLNVGLNTQCVMFDFLKKEVSRIGIVSGAGTSALYFCKSFGIDCLVTGEIDHASYHPAKELGISLIGAGHYKTEVPGILAVLKELENHLGLDCKFIDFPTGL